MGGDEPSKPSGPISGFLEKSTKYTKSWSKRFVSFDPETRKLEYGESATKTKHSMTVTNIVRASEKSPKAVAGSPELYSFAVDGKSADGKVEGYSVRCPDAASFNEWFFAIRNALGRSGDMEPFNCGLPDRDPRTNLPLAHVPVEHLFRFNLLDRAILYLFKEVAVQQHSGGEPVTQLLVIGDRYLYLFAATAEVERCLPLVSIRHVYCGSGCIGIKAEETQHDILIVNCLFVSEIAAVLQAVFQAIPNATPIEPDTTIAAQSAIAAQLHLEPRDGYNLKVMAPTPKAKLKAAMVVYEKQTGQPFVYGSAAKPAAALPSNAVHQAPEAMDMEDPMAALLLRLGLRQYVVQLQRQHVDLDLIACMDAEDLANFGVDDPKHRELISAAAKGEPLPGTMPAAPASPNNAGRPPAKAITLSDSDDDFTGPQKQPAPAPQRPMITLSSDDDDDLPIMPPKKPLVLDDDDDDLPGPSTAASFTTSKSIALDDDI